MNMTITFEKQIFLIYCKTQKVMTSIREIQQEIDVLNVQTTKIKKELRRG